MNRWTLGGVAILVGLWVWGPWRQASQTPTEAERNRAFESSMAGVTLVGKSTTDGRPGLSGEERYRIEKVTHMSGDTWLFQTRIQIEGLDIPVPFPLFVKWAGDTPVLTLTELTIPGLGTYTARVVLYRDQYAGTWSGERRGGQLFGKIVRNGKP